MFLETWRRNGRTAVLAWFCSHLFWEWHLPRHRILHFFGLVLRCLKSWRSVISVVICHFFWKWPSWSTRIGRFTVPWIYFSGPLYVPAALHSLFPGVYRSQWVAAQVVGVTVRDSESLRTSDDPVELRKEGVPDPTFAKPLGEDRLHHPPETSIPVTGHQLYPSHGWRDDDSHVHPQEDFFKWYLGVGHNLWLSI